MNLDPIDSLTQRETEILWLLDARLSNEEIAAVLHILPATVRSHRSSIYGELMDPVGGLAPCSGVSMMTPSAGRAATPTDAFMAWIAELRARLNRGDLAQLPPVDIGHGTDILPTEHTVRIMLADQDHFDDMDPNETADPVTAARRARLRVDFYIPQLLIDKPLPLSALATRLRGRDGPGATIRGGPSDIP
jgi:hypothetical protein